MIISYYAAFLALMFVFLSVRTIRMRRRLRIALGDGGNPQMVRAMRVHSNFAEYVPFALILIWMVESRGAEPWAVHTMAALLVVGRLSHFNGVRKSPEDFRFRVAGMMMTFAVYVLSAGALVIV